jgi:hypothetical protein
MVNLKRFGLITVIMVCTAGYPAYPVKAERVELANLPMVNHLLQSLNGSNLLRKAWI